MSLPVIPVTAAEAAVIAAARAWALADRAADDGAAEFDRSDGNSAAHGKFTAACRAEATALQTMLAAARALIDTAGPDALETRVADDPPTPEHG